MNTLEIFGIVGIVLLFMLISILIIHYTVEVYFWKKDLRQCPKCKRKSLQYSFGGSAICVRKRCDYNVRY